MLSLFTLAALTLKATTTGQQLGPTPEIHPELTTQTCNEPQGCIPQRTSVVLDSQWRNVVDVFTGALCVTEGGTLNETICPNADECARNCALDGINYLDTGVEVHKDSITLHMYRKYRGKLVNVQPQVYLLEGGDYAMLSLLNQELSFDVDVSNLSCGMNGAMYLTAMDPSGGRSRLNPAGATYGTGYCDSQCNHGYNFVNGVANINHTHGTCCNEMDLWEANARSNQFTTHPCNIDGFYACFDKECELGNKGPCARTGCGFNPYGLGAHHFYGRRGTVDTNKPFRVVTQFLTANGTTNGILSEIRRFYVQSGIIIESPVIEANGMTFDSMTTGFCDTASPNAYLSHKHGGLPKMGEALKRGMVLVMGIWNDPIDFNRWLDSGSAGPCRRKQGDPAIIKENNPTTSITFSNIRCGDINSTYSS